jgi:hypothetical protein
MGLQGEHKLRQKRSLSSHVFTAILLLMEYVKTLNDRYLSKESFFKQFV